MESFSIPFTETEKCPAIKLGTMYKNFKLPYWWCIPTGVYSYIQKILELNGEYLKYHCNSHISSIQRNCNLITLNFENGEIQQFDKLIFATPPSQILKLLKNPSQYEIEYFQHWRTTKFKTIAHTDNSLYDRYSKTSKTIADFFIKSDNTFGYNTYINHIYNLSHQVPYNFSHNLEEFINKDKIISEATHITPIHEKKSYQYRDKILDLSGQNNTLFVGAYLKEGSQEGATQSALHASKLLEGDRI